jgi:hypothetical protein
MPTLTRRTPTSLGPRRGYFGGLTVEDWPLWLPTLIAALLVVSWLVH